MKASKLNKTAIGIALLRRAAKIPPDLTDEETSYLMKSVLRLPLSYFQAVTEVIGANTWQKAEWPIAYVRMAAIYRAVNSDAYPEMCTGLGTKLEFLVKQAHGLVTRSAPKPAAPEAVPDHPKKKPSRVSRKPYYLFPNLRNDDDKLMSNDEYIDFLEETENDGTRPGYDDDDYSYDHDDYYLTPGLRYLKQRFSNTPHYIAEVDERAAEILGFDEPTRFVNWCKIAEDAGLDDGELDVLWCMLDGQGRDSALKLCRNTAERRQLQAAFKRFQRKRAMERIKAVLTKHATPTKPRSKPVTKLPGPLRPPLACKNDSA